MLDERDNDVVAGFLFLSTELLVRSGAGPGFRQSGDLKNLSRLATGRVLVKRITKR